MIIVRMRGGLGNQLFIYAFSLFLQFLTGDAEMAFDVREYKKYRIRSFELTSILKTNIMFYNKKSLKYDFTRGLFHIKQHFSKNNYLPISKSLCKRGLFYSGRNGFDFTAFKKKHCFIYGYFQDVRMVNAIKENLLDRLNISVTNNYEISDWKETICISVRAGKDYSDQGWRICSSNYYVNAIKEIMDEKHKNNPTIIVFSDEIQFAKKMLSSFNPIFVENMSPVEQLKMMTLCEDYVISNSSFAWWGAYLGKKPDSIIIMPDEWYPGEKTEDTLLTFQGVRIRNANGF